MRLMIRNAAWAAGWAEGRADAARRVIFRYGEKRFRTPPAATAAFLASLHDADQLEAMADRVLDAAGWQDLLTGA